MLSFYLNKYFYYFLNRYTNKRVNNYFFSFKNIKKAGYLELFLKKDKVKFNLKIILNLRNLEIKLIKDIRIHICLVFSSDSSSELHIFWHDGDSFSMDSTEIGIFEESDQISFCGFLQRKDCLALESKVRFELSGDFSYQSLER